MLCNRGRGKISPEILTIYLMKMAVDVIATSIGITFLRHNKSTNLKSHSGDQKLRRKLPRDPVPPRLTDMSENIYDANERSAACCSYRSLKDASTTFTPPTVGIHVDQSLVRPLAKGDGCGTAPQVEIRGRLGMTALMDSLCLISGGLRVPEPTV